MTTEFIYTWPNGRQEVRYRRPMDSPEALEMINDVLDLQAKHGAACPYSFRHVRFTAEEIAYMNSDSFKEDQ